MAAVQVPRTPALPAAGTWALDTTHTDVSFTARHLMVTKVRGRFAVSGGTVTIAENPLDSSVEATIDVASVNSGEAGRDADLLSADFFDVEHYPTITFRSTKVVAAGDGNYELTGELTVKDVTRPVTSTSSTSAPSTPRSATPAPGSARARRSVARTGASTGTWQRGGGAVLGDKIKLNIDAETILQK